MSRAIRTTRWNGQIAIIPIENVACFIAEDKYVTVFHDDGEDLITDSLADLEALYCERLIRTHRCALIEQDRAEGMDRYARFVWARRARADRVFVPISRRRRPVVRRLISNICNKEKVAA